jgi:hypothetical protein
LNIRTPHPYIIKNDTQWWSQFFAQQSFKP